MKLVMIGALGGMLGPSSKHLHNCPGVEILRVLDRGTKGGMREEFRKNWHHYGAELVSSLDYLLHPQDFDGVVICAGKNGDDFPLLKIIVPQLKKGTFILHLSTVSVNFVKATADFCHAQGIIYANYPLTGGVSGALNASMLILASGPKSLFDDLHPFLSPLGKPTYLGPKIEEGAVTKLIGHILVFNGLIGISTALALHASYQGKSSFSHDQVEFFDALNQGAGGTRQWEVALKAGVESGNWEKGFMLKYALADCLYLIELLLSQNLPTYSLFELAFTFTFLLQEGLAESSTQILALYILDREKRAKVQAFLKAECYPQANNRGKLAYCVRLMPSPYKEGVMLDLSY